MRAAAMKIPRHWVRAARTVTGPDGAKQLVAWGWSASDRGEAARVAEERLERVIRAFGEGAPPARGYAYGERPLREEIVQELPGRRGEDPEAVVTRNAYGALVLNTSRVLFVDVDLPAETLGDAIRRWLGRGSLEETTLGRLRSAVSSHRFRIYRTAAGFRLLAVDDVFEPGSADAESVMTALGADPAFVRLCRFQESFRARLTPKPWRCDVPRPDVRYPFEGDAASRFAEWLARYERATEGFATCRFVEETGSGWTHREVEPVLRLHDDTTRASSGLPLA